MSNKEIRNKTKIAIEFTKNVIANVDGKNGFYNFPSTEAMEYYRFIPYFVYSHKYMFFSPNFAHNGKHKKCYIKKVIKDINKGNLDSLLLPSANNVIPKETVNDYFERLFNKSPVKSNNYN